LRTLRSRTPRLRAFLPLIVAGVFALAATTAAGFEPNHVRPIDDSAFGRIELVTGAGTFGAADPAAPTPSFDLRPLSDSVATLPLPVRPQPPLPSPGRIVVNVAPPTTHSITGRASWYCNADDPSGPLSICHNAYPDGPGFDAYAAAGPGLRAAIGSGWRNTVVYVCGHQCVRVRLVDWCKCTGGSVGVEKLIDLYYDVYVLTGSNVVIRW